MHSVWIEVIPALDGLCGTRFSSNPSPSFGTQLYESLFVTMVWLVLRYEDKIGFFDFGKMLDSTRDDMLSDSEPLSTDNGSTGQPWIDKYAECAVN